MTVSDVYELPFNVISLKASHNSYDDKGSLAQQLSWRSSEPYRFGCRGLELDLVQNSRSWEWRVRHGGKYSDGGPQFATLLKQLAAWSDRYDGHDPVVVHLDVKNAPLGSDDYPEALDRYVRSHFYWRRIFRPRHLLSGSKDLVASAMASGWPTLGELRRKFILCLTGREDVKKHYAETDPVQRLCFADAQIGVGPSFWTPSLNKGDRIFFNISADIDQVNWPRAVAWFAKKQGFVTRVFGANTPLKWGAARRAGANVIATDGLEATWAKLSEATPFGCFAPSP